MEDSADNLFRALYKKAVKESPRDSGVRYAGESTALPTQALAEAILKSNAANQASSVAPGALSARYLYAPLNAAGYTINKGALSGLPVVANATRGVLSDLVNTQAHEAYHSRVLSNNGMPKTTNSEGQLVESNSRQNPNFYSLMNLLRSNQPTDQYGPNWGLNPSSSPEEQIASIAGYEGMQPKGTSIVDTKLGQQMTPQQRDYYLTQSSVPFGGIWEGQVKDESYAQKLARILRDALIRSGINTVNR